MDRHDLTKDVVAATVNKIKVRRPVIAVDFDGTIVEDYFPDIGPPIAGVKESLRVLQNFGCEIVIWSARNNPVNIHNSVNKPFEDMKEFLKAEKIPYDKIDDGTSGKLVADVYVDNKALSFNGDWDGVTFHILQNITTTLR